MLTTAWPSRTANSVCGPLFCYSCEPLRCGPAKLTVPVPVTSSLLFLACKNPWQLHTPGMQWAQVDVKMRNCIVPTAWQRCHCISQYSRVRWYDAFGESYLMTRCVSSPECWGQRGSLLFLGGLIHIQPQDREGCQPANLEHLGVGLCFLLW